MEDNKYLLTARQYNELYCRAFSRLEDIARAAEQAMKELEELQLSMGDSWSSSSCPWGTAPPS